MDLSLRQNLLTDPRRSLPVLGNIKALKNGSLNPVDIGSPIKVWKDVEGNIWSLDNRRLAAFKEAGINNIPVQWATRREVKSQVWKMPTKTGGVTIKLKIAPGQSQILGQ